MNVSPAEVTRFRHAIVQSLGLVFEDRKLEYLADLLDERAAAQDLTTTDYLTLLEADPKGPEPRVLASALTVGETYFFRHVEQFRAFAEAAVPERLRARQGRALSVLSVGCASGEEPYTIAMLLSDRLGHGGVPWHVHALDVNPAAIEKARVARYASWALRETSAELRERFFVQDGRMLALDPRIKNAVTFEEHNMARPHPTLFREPRFDIVFCRNMIMYLHPQLAAEVVAQLARALVPGGFLFLGHAETLRGVSGEFRLRKLQGAVYYERCDPTRRADVAAPETTPTPLEPPSTLGLEPAIEHGEPNAGHWFDAIAEASESIAARAHGAGPLAELDTPLRLLQDERFGEALAHLVALPNESAHTRDALLLRAVLLAHSGDFRAAKQVCAELLCVHELHAGAHYLFALCREGEGDLAGASEHDRTAVYLDPTFAMPRLHLGVLAGRRGDRELARRELAEALVLLEREDPSRLSLFGGGFRRAALLEMCRAQLAAYGAAP